MNMKSNYRQNFIFTAIAAMLALATTHAADVTPQETKAIAEEAFIYGFPMVMNYGVMNEYFIDKSSSQYKCGFNQIYNMDQVYTPKDTAVVTPNSDTPYSFFCADLRAEPVVVTVPEIEKNRYYSIQLVDMYTFNYGYIGSRATGHGAGKFMITGPGWKGEKPAGIEKVFPCETDFTFGIIRTQLFNPADIDNVKKVQTGYKDPYEKYDMTFNGAVSTRTPTTSPGRYAGYDNGWVASLVSMPQMEFDKSIVDFPNIKRFPGGASNDMTPNLQDPANPLPLMDIKKAVRTIGGAD